MHPFNWPCALGATACLIFMQPPVRADELPPFASCVRALRHDLPDHPEVRPETFDAQVQGVEDLRQAILDATERQPEFTLDIWDYIARLVDAQRIADGRVELERQAGPLQAIERRRGVDPATAVAVFGVETDYGRVSGRHRVVDATLSRACLAPGSQERKRHFFAALWLLQQGLVQPDNFRGSWAGAFGLTQFMPGTFVTYMDRGDPAAGPVDIVGNPADALATTAHFIAGSGWVRGVRWGIEVAMPTNMAGDWVATERQHGCLAAKVPARDGKCRRVDQWATLGVRPIGAATLPDDATAALLAPSGATGPAWLVTRNYQAIWQYNRADAYALAIGLLSDALRGDPPQRTGWPTADLGLGRLQMRALQAELIRRGHVEVNTDGYDGPRTRDAIRSEERRLGLSETGHPGMRIVKALEVQ